jgi:uncharacterized protein YqjF (DUF2071 family)
MYQSWRDLAFIHAPVEPAVIQATLPSRLTIDTFPDDNGREWAWVGLVPFKMRDVRLSGCPAVPGTQHFFETNLRTYVHLEGADPGVWFYSLDAANALACAIARRWYGLPYHAADMTITKSDSTYDYRSVRKSDAAMSEVKVTVGETMPMPLPGSLEFFLLERYLLYSLHQNQLRQGQVWHSPYLVQSVESFTVIETLSAATGINVDSYLHARFSPGVKVMAYAPVAI